MLAACVASSGAWAETDEALEIAVALAESPPALDVTAREPPADDASAGSGSPVNLLIAVHKTATSVTATHI